MLHTIRTQSHTAQAKQLESNEPNEGRQNKTFPSDNIKQTCKGTADNTGQEPQAVRIQNNHVMREKTNMESAAGKKPGI